MILTVYTINNRAPNYLKQKLIEKGEIVKSIVIPGDADTFLDN